jgi:hypothetical protein
MKKPQPEVDVFEGLALGGRLGIFTSDWEQERERGLDQE